MSNHSLQERKHDPHGRSVKTLVAIGLTGLLLAATTAQAVAFTSDLSITGSVAYDTSYATANLGGNAVQSGALSATQGGANTSSTFSQAVVTGGNPLLATLTDLGDGFGFSGTASVSDANPSGSPLFGIGVDVGLNLANNSASDTYKIIFNIAFNNAVDAGGSDAYAHSNFQVFDRAGSNTLFFSDLMSDTLGTSGSITESGPASFAITLLAGQTFTFDPTVHDLSWTLDGGSYSQDGVATSSLDAFLSIASVENLSNTGNPNPNPAPEPATLALLGAGLLGLRLSRRRASR